MAEASRTAGAFACQSAPKNIQMQARVYVHMQAQLVFSLPMGLMRVQGPLLELQEDAIQSGSMIYHSPGHDRQAQSKHN